MSLAGFQRAMADLAASPALGAAVLDDPGAALAPYPLTDLERRRLASAAAQRGMSVNRMMYRANRITPLRAQLRHTCFVLGPWLRELVDGYWDENPVMDRSAPAEVRRFAAFVRRWLAARPTAMDAAFGEVLEWEMASYELAVLPPGRLLDEVAEAAARAGTDAPLRAHPLVGVARFTRDPAVVMAGLAERRAPPYPDAAPGDYAMLLDYRVRPRALGAVSPALADAFAALRAGGEIEPALADALLEMGIAFRAG
jgi:hypothetical protein